MYSIVIFSVIKIILPHPWEKISSGDQAATPSSLGLSGWWRSQQDFFFQGKILIAEKCSLDNALHPRLPLQWERNPSQAYSIS